MRERHANRCGSLPIWIVAGLVPWVVGCGGSGIGDEWAHLTNDDPVPVSSFADCPNHAYYARQEHDSSFLALAGPIAPINEYHDCQSLRQGNSYGPVVGIWSAASLKTLEPADFETPGGEPVAQINNFSQVAYGPLGIEPGWSCLYLFKRDEEWSAAVLAQGDEPTCPSTLQGPDSARAHPLQVRRTTPGQNSDEYAHAARWDWDERQRVQVMGTLCARGWCEVGAEGFQAIPAHAGDHTRRVKGWYDEQNLLHVTPDGMARAVFRAAVFPDPRLGDRTINDFRCPDPCDPDQGWVHTATVRIRGNAAGPYKEKLNLDPGEGNEIYLRLRPENDPADQWQARIVSATGDVAYRRVIRVPHGPLEVPASARWRWRSDDETVWMRCDLGCCEVTGEELQL